MRLRVRLQVMCVVLGVLPLTMLAQEGAPPPPGGDAVFLSGPPQDGPPPPPPGAQQQGQDNTNRQRHQGQWQDRFQGLAGTVTAISADSITVKTMQGDSATVKLTKDTAYRRDRAEAKLSDFKTGEMVFVAFAGEQAKDGSYTARLVAMRSDMANMMGQGGSGMSRRGGMAEQFNPADLGKTFIAGEITKIDETKLTIHRMDGVDQVIAVDDDTSFRNPRMRDESITLADFKVGDHVMGRGELKNGTFVPKVLSLMPARRLRTGDAPAAAPPASTPKQE